MKADTHGFNLDWCSNIYRNISSINLSNKQICSGSENGSGNICSGDSGDLVDFRFEIHQQQCEVTILGLYANRWSVNG